MLRETIADAQLLPWQVRSMTPAELYALLEAHVRRMIHAMDGRAWLVAHILQGLGAVPRGIAFARLMQALLGRTPGTLREAPPVVEPPDVGLTPEQSVDWMHAFVANAKSRARRRANG